MAALILCGPFETVQTAVRVTVAKHGLEASGRGRGCGVGASQWDLYAQESGLEGRAVGTSLLGAQLSGEQTKAAGEVGGRPASPGAQGHGSC